MSKQRATNKQRASDRLQKLVVRRRDPVLEDAIEQDRIAIHFQPQIEPATGRIVAVEALARWDGEPSASELFQRARRGGLKERLSRFAQRKALRMAGAWPAPLSDLRISINLLAEDLGRDGYDQWLLEEIALAGLAPDRVTVEITEDSLLADGRLIAERLGRLREAGIQIAVDDFGTGYANLAYLTSLPLDTLKIDRGLITDLAEEKRGRIVVRAMIDMARQLDLKVVVEGVETPEQLALIADWGCDLYQGFLGSGALAEQDLAELIQAAAA
ncbi:EAL domain-containing protein [Sphingomonas alba]|uniref:EAL domain-containing protein n=1 Tax=Sphingomonas alba TaxID=2908208 RepID=A0ABT0RIK7_9SPHN|nr:EAL domain-containing protein [Sphingomonas alba]MCL6682461.1 EAL domain-containing protein [Sphingomonas alba]